jgi:5-hydroxyisourate hydrolase
MTLSTHVLDLAAGGPAAGVAVALLAADGTTVAAGKTGADGRLNFEGDLPAGDYTLRFELEPLTELFDAVSLGVRLRDQRHYHLPLLISPFGLSSYRGS